MYFNQEQLSLIGNSDCNAVVWLAELDRIRKNMVKRLLQNALIEKKTILRCTVVVVTN